MAPLLQQGAGLASNGIDTLGVRLEGIAVVAQGTLIVAVGKGAVRRLVGHLARRRVRAQGLEDNPAGGQHHHGHSESG